MKPKEIIKRADLSKGFDKRGQELFFSIMVEELITSYKAFGVEDSYRHFDAAIKCVRSKWDSISNKIPHGLTDGVWAYFYASRIAPVKEKMCPTWKARNDAWVRKRDEKRAKREAKKH